jgi:hypothetical protein
LKRLITYLLPAALLACVYSFHPTAKLFIIKGKITQTSDYCGGAYIRELIERAKTPVPYPDKTIYFKKGNKNSLRSKVITKATTDKDGNFEVNLEPGTYCVVEEYKTEKIIIPPNSSTTTYDSNCINSLWQECDYTLTVDDKDITDFVINYHHHCFYSQPCQLYKGPRPQ